MLLTELMKKASDSYSAQDHQMQDTLSQLLEGQSQRDLELWLASPFWKAVMALIQEQTHRNVEDLTRGDIAVRSQVDEGLLYRSDESLRGGIIAMTHIMETLPSVLIQELELANWKDDEEEDSEYLTQEEEDGRG